MPELTAQEGGLIKSRNLIVANVETAKIVLTAFFRKQYKELMTNKLLVNFDCVSNGDTLLLTRSKAARKDNDSAIADAFHATEEKHFLLEKSEIVYYPSDQAGFAKSMAVAALKHKKGIGYHIDRIHAHKDTNFDVKNITLLRDSTVKFMETL